MAGFQRKHDQILDSHAALMNHLPNQTYSWLIIIDINIPCEFFTPTLADGFLLESKWQQVFLSLQGSSQYFIRSQ